MSAVLPMSPGPPAPVASGLPAAGGIPGGLLRPGAIDQEAFKKALERARAGAPEPAAPGPSPRSRPVELNCAQLQALIGERTPPEAAAPASTPSIAPPADDAGQDVLVLRRFPGKDERAMLSGRAWRVEEDPRSRALYFGADGKFGFDDLLDLVNPLQHIPLVNVLYRQITGDEIAGAPRLLGSIFFGPLSVAATIADLAVISTTGKSMADNAIAFALGTHGDGQGGVAPGAQLAMRPGEAQAQWGSRRS